MGMRVMMVLGGSVKELLVLSEVGPISVIVSST
jgi:hypothetical protein